MTHDDVLSCSIPPFRRFVVWWLSATFWHGAASLVLFVVQSEIVPSPHVILQLANPGAEWIFGSRSLIGLVRSDFVLLESEPALALGALALNSLATGMLVAALLLPIWMLMPGRRSDTQGQPSSKAGRSITLVVIAFILGLHGAVILHSLATGEFRGLTIFRTSLTIALCVAFWLGYAWARWLTVACLCAAAGYGLIAGWRNGAPELAALAAVTLVAAALVSSRPVGRYLAAKRLRSHVEPITPKQVIERH